MRFTSIAVVALALPLMGNATRIRDRQSEQSVPGISRPVAKRYIVEFAAGAVKARDGLNALDDIKILKSFDSDIFRGASIETDSYNIDSLTALADVAKVWLNEQVQLAPTTPILQGLSDDAASMNYTTHNVTGVSKLHNLGIYGKGVVVGVVDTGTWYNHPALGGGFGPGFKVAKGYDFVGNVFWPSEGEKEPDEDPLDQVGHGTHVAGIIAGKSDIWTGVAPEATIYSYKVFSQSGNTDSATLIDAFIAAYEDGCDIITASIGGPDGWSTNAWAEVASRIVDEGIVVTISAGNSGDAGPFYASSGSSGKNVIAIASVETEMLPSSPFLASFTLDGQTNTTKVGYIPSTYNFPPTVLNWPIVPMNLDITSPIDGCEKYPDGTPSLVGKIPLVRRGGCTFDQKQANLEALGASYILIYNNEGVLTTPAAFGSSLLAMITRAAGEAIVATVKAGGQVTGDFSLNPDEVVGLEYAAGGHPSVFTSWGGLNDLHIKPDIAAPGGKIFSTYLEDSYAVLSGTSMACPYVAGVAALYISAHGGRSVHGKGFGKMLSNRIISSGKALPWADETATDFGYAASVAQVGNGLIDAFKVVQFTTTLDFEKIALNDTRYFSRYHDVSVTNGGQVPVSYTFSAQDVAGVEAAAYFAWSEHEGDYRLKTRVELTPEKMDVEISFPRAFTLKPGESKTVSVNFKNPNTRGWNATALPLYSGKILVSGSNGEQLSVPYMGLGADLRKDMSSIYRLGFPIIPFREEIPFFSFDLGIFNQDFVRIHSTLVWGSKEIRLDIYEAGWSERQWEYPPVPGRNGYVGPAAIWAGSGLSGWFDPSRDDPNDTWTMPQINVPRDDEVGWTWSEYWWFGRLGNGSQIELGHYTMHFATLKPFGDPKHADNWSLLKFPQIKVTGKY